MALSALPAAKVTARESAGAFRLALRALYAVSLAGIAVLLARGLPFYLAPPGERAHHPGYWEWKPGGSTGRLLGTVGAALMVLMLAYSLRKRVPALRRLGPLARWLDVHIYFGVVGPLLVILHSSFKVQGLVALSFWSMMAVALSGVLGRYLYLQIPRTRAGDEMTLGELEAQDRALTARLRFEFGLGDGALQRLAAACAPPAVHGGLAGALLGLLAEGVSRRRRLRAFARGCRQVPPGLWRQFESTLRQKAIAQRRLVFWERLHQAFRYWHVVHKPFAIVMYLFMVVHVGVAVATGYAWGGRP
jgi:hypothetical protein